jgi:hypothetical protein
VLRNDFVDFVISFSEFQRQAFDGYFCQEPGHMRLVWSFRIGNIDASRVSFQKGFNPTLLVVLECCAHADPRTIQIANHLNDAATLRMKSANSRGSSFLTRDIRLRALIPKIWIG